MTKVRAGALVVLADAILLNQRKQIAELAAKAHLPSVSTSREYAEAGSLIVYSADFLDLERRAATYVDISKHVGRVNRESIVVGQLAA
jgi:putative ABC transport system substrate-binding protein